MKLTDHGWGVTPLSIDPAKAEAAVDATLNVVDEVTRLTVELATIRDTHARELQSVAEAVREACADQCEGYHFARIIRALDLAPIISKALGGGR